MIRFRPPLLASLLVRLFLASSAGNILGSEPEVAAAAVSPPTPAPPPTPEPKAAPVASLPDQKIDAIARPAPEPEAPATEPKAPPVEIVATVAEPHVPATVAVPATPVASAAAPATEPAVAPAAAPAAEAHAPAVAAPASPVVAAGTLPGAEISSLLKLGTALTDRGDFDAAAIAYHQVIRGRGVAENDVKTGLLGLARMHRRQGSFTKAAAIYETFLKEYPEDARTPDALLDLGRTLRGLGAHALAITRFYSVINSTLKLSDGGFERYQLLAKTAQFEIAETHFQSGNFAEAAKFFTRLRLLDFAPADRARAHFKTAYAQHLQGLPEATVTTLRAFLDQWPQDENVPEARYLLAITLRAMNRPQEAFNVTLDLLRTARTLVASDPKRWAYWQRRTGNQLANDFFANGDIHSALGIYSGLAELSPDRTWRLPILYQTGLCHERLGDEERAAAAYRTIIDTLGTAPAPELGELARLATWRFNHLEWKTQTTREVTSLFNTSTGRAPARPPAPATPATAALP